MIPYEWIEQAAERIAPHIRSTPLTYDAQHDLYLKWENHQVTGSFKIRGALNKILSLQPWERERGIVTASAGNHGQGVALAGRLVGAPVIVFASDHAVPAKLEAMRELGADVRLVPGGYGEAEEAGLQFAASSGAAWVSPYNDGQVIAGQATLAVEILQEQPALLQAAWVVPGGGGGLISGIGAALKFRGPIPPGSPSLQGKGGGEAPFPASVPGKGSEEAPLPPSASRESGESAGGGPAPESSTAPLPPPASGKSGKRAGGDPALESSTAPLPPSLSGRGGAGGVGPTLIGVQSEASPFLQRLYHTGSQAGAVELPSLADGLSGPVEDRSLTIPLARRTVDDFVLVSEKEIAQAIAFAWRQYGERIEGSAAAALAAVLSKKILARPAVVVISGGNIQDEVHVKIVSSEHYSR